MKPQPTMQDDNRKTDPPFLKRWSQRKLAAARTAPDTAPPATRDASAPSVVAPATDADRAVPGAAESAPAPLPSVESLSFDSDFTPFLKPDVDESLRAQALKKLVNDPRFNVMDGLDVYIDDYSKPDPIAPEVLAQLNQLKYLFDPPKTRVNAQGHVEDVPEDERLADDPAAAPVDEQASPKIAAATGNVEIVDNTTNALDATDLPLAPVDAVLRPDASK